MNKNQLINSMQYIYSDAKFSKYSYYNCGSDGDFYDSDGDCVSYDNEHDGPLCGIKHFRDGNLIAHTKYENNNVIENNFYFGTMKIKIEYSLNKNIRSITKEENENKIRYSYIDGKIYSINNYKHGQNDGMETIFDTKGSIKSVKNHKNGKYHGSSYSYYCDREGCNGLCCGCIVSDEICCIFEFDNGKRIKHTYYRRNGKLKEVIFFDDIKCIQRRIYYYNNGKINHLKVWSSDCDYLKAPLIAYYNNSYKKKFYKNKQYLFM